MKQAYNNISEPSAKVGKIQSNRANQSRHPLLRLLTNFWQFSLYYAEFKNRSRGH